MSHFACVVFSRKNENPKDILHQFRADGPDPKWDWYKLGGRWYAYFKLRKGSVGKQGDPSTLLDNPAYPKGRCDEALIEDIIFNQVSKPYAFIDLEGKWHAIGTMMMFGMSVDEDTKKYNAEWKAYTALMKPAVDVKVSAYDLHAA
jgi:hypothetical protein